jgi:hypothetical protein
MRRSALPWLTVGLLVLGVGAGVGLGIAGQTPTPAQLTGTATAQISRIVAATRRAGTARFTYASTGTSTNRLLRATSRGSGEVDFGAATLQTTQRDRSIGFSGSSLSTERPVTQENVIDQVWIGRTEYTRLEFNDNADSPWIKGPTFPKNTFGSLGALQQVGPLGELSLDEGVPGLRVEDIGSGTVHGAPTTEYELVVPTCDASTPKDGLSESTGPLQLWVDGHGRLVQARQSMTEDIAKDAHVGDGDALPGQRLPAGRVTTVSIIDLGDFGAPVAIVAPPVLVTHGSSEVGFALSVRAHCR